MIIRTLIGLKILKIARAEKLLLPVLRLKLSNTGVGETKLGALFARARIARRKVYAGKQKIARAEELELRPCSAKLHQRPHVC